MNKNSLIKITLFFAFLSLTCGHPLLASPTNSLVRTKSNSSLSLQFIISKEQASGVYMIWDLSTNKKVGGDIIKSNDDEAFGKVPLSDNNFNHKFVILDSNGKVVFTLADQSEKKSIDKNTDPMGIGQNQMPSNQELKIKPNQNSDAKKSESRTLSLSSGTDQLGYLDRMIIAQKNQLRQIEKKSRINKLKIQRLLQSKGIDCQKELDSDVKTSPEIEIFCQSTKELRTAYIAAEEQLKKTSALKIEALKAIDPTNKSAISQTEKIAIKNLELPTNLDPKSLNVPNQTVDNKEAKEIALGSWGLAQRFYEVAEYCICQCGSSTAQVPGKSCPANSTSNGCYNIGPYYLNNAGTRCDLNASPPTVKFVTDAYTPSTLSGGTKASHGKDVIAQAKALRESGEIKKLTGPEAMEFMIELGQVASVTQSYKEGIPIETEMQPMREIWAKYMKEQESLQAKNREEKLNPPQKIYGDLTFKFLDLEKKENRVPINTLAVVPITEPVSLSGGIAEVRLIGGFWGQHGWEVSTDKKNFFPIEKPAEIKNGDVIYLRGQSVNSYNHGFGIEVTVSAKTVNGHNFGYNQFVFLKTEDGCNSDGMMQMDYQENLAPHTFPVGQNEKCFTLPGVFGEEEKGKEGIWRFGQGIVTYAPMKPLGSEVQVDCSEINRLAGKTTAYKIGAYINPFTKLEQDYFPVRDCKISGKIKYVCRPNRGWVRAEDSGVCELE